MADFFSVRGDEGSGEGVGLLGFFQWRLLCLGELRVECVSFLLGLGGTDEVVIEEL